MSCRPCSRQTHTIPRDPRLPLHHACRSMRTVAHDVEQFAYGLHPGSLERRLFSVTSMTCKLSWPCSVCPYRALPTHPLHSPYPPSLPPCNAKSCPSAASHAQLTQAASCQCLVPESLKLSPALSIIGQRTALRAREPFGPPQHTHNPGSWTRIKNRPAHAASGDNSDLSSHCPARSPKHISTHSPAHDGRLVVYRTGIQLVPHPSRKRWACSKSEADRFRFGSMAR